MPRPPSPESKTNRLVLAPKPGEEAKVNAFKEICSRDGYRISDELLKLVERWLREHNWPPGNPQLPLTKFSGDRIPGTPFKAQITITRKDPLGRGHVEETKSIQVSERELQQLLVQWQGLSERGKRIWVRILKQVDHPIARKILEEMKS